MKKIFLSTLILILFFFSCKSKDFSKENLNDKGLNYIPYYLKVNEADSLFICNKYERSYEILDSLFKIYPPINMEGWYEYGNYLSSSVMSGHIIDIDKKVKMTFVNFGGVSCLHPDSFDLKNKVLKASGLSDEEIEHLKKEYFSKLNLTLRDRIVKLKKEDQSVRLEKNSDTGMIFFEKKHSKDIIEIFNKYGYPNHLLVGSDNYFENSADIRSLLMHQTYNDSITSKLLPMLLEYVGKGKCDPSVYAAVYDKYMWKKVGKQYYGTFPSYKENRFNYPPLLNPSKIDSIRKSIGLPSLKYNDWRNIKLEE